MLSSGGDNAGLQHCARPPRRRLERLRLLEQRVCRGAWARVNIDRGAWARVTIDRGAWARVTIDRGAWARVNIDRGAWARVNIDREAWARVTIDQFRHWALQTFLGHTSKVSTNVFSNKQVRRLRHHRSSDTIVRAESRRDPVQQLSGDISPR